MSAEEDDKLDHIIRKIDKINLGLYGDADNKIPGLMQGHYELKEDVHKLKEFKKKATWVSLGLSTAWPAIVYFFKSKFNL
jgi:hypothetical protein